MLTAPLSLLTILLSCYTTPIACKKIACAEAPAGELKPTSADCRAAIALIPDGTIAPDGSIPNPNEPLNFLLPPRARGKIPFPAAFRSASCEVIVGRPFMEYASAADPLQPPQHTPAIPKPATAMYFDIWPDVRRGAQSIVRECMQATGPQLVGTLMVQSTVGGRKFTTVVRVTGRKADDHSGNGIFQAMPLLRHARAVMYGIQELAGILGNGVDPGPPANPGPAGG